MSWLGLRYKGVEPLYPDEWNKVVEGLDILYGGLTNLKSNVESLDAKVNAYYLDAKSEIKTLESEVNTIKTDIASLSDKVDIYYLEIKSELKELKSEVDPISDYVREIYLMKVPSLLVCLINEPVVEGTDIFPIDIPIDRSGRARFKLLLTKLGYVQVKLISPILPIEILGYLNAGEPIPSDAWHEFDFTVMKDDMINVRVYPSQNITIFIYSLGEV